MKILFKPKEPALKQRIEWFASLFELSLTGEEDEAELVVQFPDGCVFFDEIGLKKLLDLSIASSRSIAVFDDPSCVMASAIENRHSALETPLQIDGSSYCGSFRDFFVNGGRREAVWEVLKERIIDLHRTPLADLDSLLGADDIIKAIISFGSEKDIDWVEHKVCPLCSSPHVFRVGDSDFSSVHGFIDVSDVYLRCADCSHVTLKWTVEDRSSLSCFYTDINYDRHLTTQEFEQYIDAISDDTVSHFKNYEVMIANLDQQRALNDGAINVVDIGGGLGEFAVLFRRSFPKSQISILDWHAPQVVVETLDVKHDINFELGDIFESLDRLPDRSVDFFTAWEVIEHLRPQDLSWFLTTIHKKLKDNGMVFLSTPDLGAPCSHLLAFWAAFPGEHLSVFNRKNIRLLFEKHKFKSIVSESESVKFRASSGWFDHGIRASGSRSVKVFCQLINILKDKSLGVELRDVLRQNQLGSEMVVGFRRL